MQFYERLLSWMNFIFVELSICFFFSYQSSISKDCYVLVTFDIGNIRLKPLKCIPT